MYVLTVFLLLNSIALCTSLEDGWKGIKPLSTDKATVSKILGEPKIDEYSGYYRYATEETFITVSYATSRCSEAEYGRGEYNVPENTVIYYRLRFQKPVKLSELKFARDRYKRATNEHEPDLVTYYSEEHGITVVTSIRDGIEFAATIEFRPRPRDAEKYKCKK